MYTHKNYSLANSHFLRDVNHILARAAPANAHLEALGLAWQWNRARFDRIVQVGHQHGPWRGSAVARRYDEVGDEGRITTHHDEGPSKAERSSVAL
jgi:hypothetical protein